jgi:hypothetical protein
MLLLLWPARIALAHSCWQNFLLIEMGFELISLVASSLRLLLLLPFYCYGFSLVYASEKQLWPFFLNTPQTKPKKNTNEREKIINIFLGF